jgi:HPt (histidine-containing phosphotransfer) domain-containing protein
MNDYLTKPIKRTALLKTIQHWANEYQAILESTPIDSDRLDNALSDYVDEAILKQLVEDTSASAVPEFISVYINDAKNRIATINQALEKQDVKTLAFETHTLGSSAIAHGNVKLHDIAREIEALCLKQAHDEAFNLTPLLVKEAETSFSLLAARAVQGFDK